MFIYHRFIHSTTTQHLHISPWWRENIFYSFDLMPFIEKFSHGACISEWRFFPIKSIQFNSRIYKSNRLQQFHFIKCAQIQVIVRETKWQGAAPGCVTSEAEHKWGLRGCMRPVIGRYWRCADISVWSLSSLWPASVSVITTTSRQGAIFFWISLQIKELWSWSSIIF